MRCAMRFAATSVGCLHGRAIRKWDTCVCEGSVLLVSGMISDVKEVCDKRVHNCSTRVAYKLVQQEPPASALQECATRVPHKSVPIECPTRVPERVSSTQVQQEWHVAQKRVQQ